MFKTITPIYTTYSFYQWHTPPQQVFHTEDHNFRSHFDQPLSISTYQQHAGHNRKLNALTFQQKSLYHLFYLFYISLFYFESTSIRGGWPSSLRLHDRTGPKTLLQRKPDSFPLHPR